MKILRLKYKDHNVYIHKCFNYRCSFMMMLHLDKCPECKTENKAKDYVLKVDDKITQQVI